jgi:hypothetical protein
VEALGLAQRDADLGERRAQRRRELRAHAHAVWELGTARVGAERRLHEGCEREDDR